MSTLEQYVLGRETGHNGLAALVVRLIQTQSVFEDSAGKCSLIEEQLVELKLPDGTPEFVSLSCIEREFEKASKIRALDPVWRPR